MRELIGFGGILICALWAGYAIGTKMPAIKEQAAQTKTRQPTRAELCMGRCYPLIVAKYDPDNHICECRSRDAK